LLDDERVLPATVFRAGASGKTRSPRPAAA
jgi:hypothetical protein